MYLMSLFLTSCFFVYGLRERPYIWLGTAPFCDGEKSHCDLFDMDYIKSSSTGDGSRCFFGDKVLCQMRDIQRPLDNTPTTELYIVSFNVFQRFFIVTHDGQYERTCHIPRALLNKLPYLDVIVFEEAFMQGCLGNSMNFRSMFAYYGFAYSTPTVGSDKSIMAKEVVSTLYKRVNGGIFLVSRWPIVRNRSYVFANSDWHTSDILANKGVVYAHIQKRQQNYHIFGTHFQAQTGRGADAARIAQAYEMKTFIGKMSIPNGEPVIIAGDFNANNISEKPIVDALFHKILRATVLTQVGTLNATYDPRINDVVDQSDSTQWIDYIAYSDDHRKPTCSSLEGVYLVLNRQITYCDSGKLIPTHLYPDDLLCQDRHTTSFTSDHFPVLGRIKLN